MITGWDTKHVSDVRFGSEINYFIIDLQQWFNRSSINRPCCLRIICRRSFSNALVAEAVDEVLLYLVVFPSDWYFFNYYFLITIFIHFAWFIKLLIIILYRSTWLTMLLLWCSDLDFFKCIIHMLQWFIHFQKSRAVLFLHWEFFVQPAVAFLISSFSFWMDWWFTFSFFLLFMDINTGNSSELYVKIMHPALHSLMIPWRIKVLFLYLQTLIFLHLESSSVLLGRILQRVCTFLYELLLHQHIG